MVWSHAKWEEFSGNIEKLKPIFKFSGHATGNTVLTTADSSYLGMERFISCALLNKTFRGNFQSGWLVKTSLIACLWNSHASRARFSRGGLCQATEQSLGTTFRHPKNLSRRAWKMCFSCWAWEQLISGSCPAWKLKTEFFMLSIKMAYFRFMPSMNRKWTVFCWAWTGNRPFLCSAWKTQFSCWAWTGNELFSCSAWKNAVFMLSMNRKWAVFMLSMKNSVLMLGMKESLFHDRHVIELLQKRRKW